MGRADTGEVKCIRNHLKKCLQCFKQYNLHSHITDDVLGQRRFQERLQNLETMEQGVWLVEMICTAVPTDGYERFVRPQNTVSSVFSFSTMNFSWFMLYGKYSNALLILNCTNASHICWNIYSLCMTILPDF